MAELRRYTGRIWADMKGKRKHGCEIEKAFVRSCITANKRERLIFELGGKRRSDGIGRFCHRADEMILKAALVKSGQYIEGDLRAVISEADDEKCYVISCYSDMDGTQIDKEEVFGKIIGRGMASIAIFEKFVIIETEQVQGPAVKYILKR